MFGKLLKSVSWQVRAELRRSLKSNRDYKKLRWNPVERILVSCSTHYVRAMLVLWSAAFGAVGVVEYFRPVLLPFAVQLKWSTKTGHRVRVFSSIDFPIRLVVTHHYIRAVLVRCNIQRYSPLLRELHR